MQGYCYWWPADTPFEAPRQEQQPSAPWSLHRAQLRTAALQWAANGRQMTLLQLLQRPTGMRGRQQQLWSNSRAAVSSKTLSMKVWTAAARNQACSMVSSLLPTLYCCIFCTHRAPDVFGAAAAMDTETRRLQAQRTEKSTLVSVPSSSGRCSSSRGSDSSC